MVEDSARVIGHYVGEEGGPLVVVIGGIHGNEPAGVRALERLFELLTEEPLINPGFTFRGELLALRGNIEALRRGRRFVTTDLNRMWLSREGAGAGAMITEPDSVEARELDGLLAVIDHVLREQPATELVLLDLHTTSAGGGAFAISGNDNPSLLLAAELGVPVVKGMLAGLTGTTLSYFRSGAYDFDRPCRAITFEAGGHAEPESVDRALAATAALLRAVGCVRTEDVSTHHDEILRRQGTNSDFRAPYPTDRVRAPHQRLPALFELAYVHKLPHKGHGFRMREGFANFQSVARATPLADDADGPILAPCDGYLLMPLYQEQGDEGFFIVSPLPPTAGY